MSSTPSTVDPRLAWRQELPVLAGQSTTLREPTPADFEGVLEVLLTAESVRFGLDGEASDEAILALIAQMQDERTTGRAFTYLVTLATSGRIIGLFQVRGLDPMFENAEWDAALLPFARGSGAFLEAAQLVGSFTFGTLGAHRLESRVLLSNGRANAALRKLGAVQEGVLRRSHRHEGQYFDQVLWSLLRNDWFGRHPATASWVH